MGLTALYRPLLTLTMLYGWGLHLNMFILVFYMHWACQIIFDRSLQTGKHPADWVKANVLPVFKKNDKYLASNYRSISLTCILCKVLEHILASNIVKHLDGQSLMYDLQHGCREKRSCETQLIMLIEDLVRNASVGKQTDIILLDFSSQSQQTSMEAASIWHARTRAGLDPSFPWE